MDKRSSFGIIAIATTMLGAMLFSSCSHDDFYYSEDKVEQIANEKYAAAFEKAFGKVGPNVDWGFSSNSANTRAVTRSGVTFPTTISFPSDCDASNFLKEVPEGVGKLPTWGGNAGFASSYYIDEETHYDMVQIYNGAAKLYVKGTIDLSEDDTNPDAPRFNMSTTSEVYLLEGSTLILGKVSAEKLIGAAIYIAKDATLKTDYPILLNSGIDVYNHGTINVKNLQVNTNSVLYNSSKVISIGTLSAESNGSDGGQSFIVNNGEIECKDVVVNGGAVLNIFTWNVTGTTEINSPNSGWINNGHWTTKDYAYVAGSENVINNCSLKVTRDFDMNISSLSGLDESKIGFKINSEGSVETENFYGGRDLSDGVVKGGPFKIRMAEYSLFKVNNKATLESGRGPMTAEEEGFGFFGPSTGGYAVFQAKDIVRDRTLANNNAHGAVTYSGNLYVSAETHFAQGNDGSNPPKWFIYERGSFSIDNNIYASGFKSGKPNITIEKTGCSPGFKGGDPLYRVIAEDLSADQAGDFDFNDVVFDVVKYDESKNLTTLRLQACGGTLPLKIGSTNGIGGVEVHSLYGENAPDATTGLYKMWNTSPTLNSHDPVDFEIDGQYTSPGQLLALRIEVQKEGVWMLLTATKGVAACKILVDDRFPIVPERTGIANKFGNFTKYVQGDWKENDGFWWVQE